MSTLITKKMADNFCKCNYFFFLEALGKNAGEEDPFGKKLASALKASSKKMMQEEEVDYRASIRFIKEYVSKIAMKEMSKATVDKTPLHEYRLAYTGRFPKRFVRQANIDAQTLINNLNNLFNIFASNNFIGYNIPVEIPIHKTNIIYRDLIDFALTDSDGNVIVVEIDDLSDPVTKQKYLEWPQYLISYLFLANSLDKDVTVNIIDPIDISNTLVIEYKKDRFDFVYEQLCEMLKPMKNTSLVVRNFYACASGCTYSDFCKEKIDWKK